MKRPVTFLAHDSSWSHKLQYGTVRALRPASVRVTLFYGTRAAWPRGFFRFDARAALSALSKVPDFWPNWCGAFFLSFARRNDASRRIAVVADRVLGRLNWAETGPSATAF